MPTVNESHFIDRVGSIAVNTDFIQTRNSTVRQSREVSYIVMHYTGNTSDTAIANVRYFSDNSLKASAHYFVDENSIYQSVALCNIAWHCGAETSYYHTLCRNANSVGIEMCCTENYTVSEATIENTAWLTAKLCRMLEISADEVDSRILRHYDVTHKSCPRQWSGDSGGFDEFKARLKNILKGEDEIMSKEYDELKGEIDALKNNAEKIYHYGTELPEWGKETVVKLTNKGYFKGISPEDLNLSESMLRTLVVNDRAGLYD